MDKLSHVKFGVFLLTFSETKKNMEVYQFLYSNEIMMRRREEKRHKAVLDKPRIKIEYLDE